MIKIKKINRGNDVREGVDDVSERKDARSYSGLAFVACMFIGAGIGLAFGRPDIGGAIGMGVGFLVMAMIRSKGVEAPPLTVSLPKSFGQIVLSIAGVLIIVSGLLLLFNPELLYPYVVGIGVVVMGIAVLLGGLIGWRKKKGE